MVKPPHLPACTFLSTLPARGATSRPTIHPRRCGFLSTLPARGATTSRPRLPASAWNFYPRSPRGERPFFTGRTSTAWPFLSTLPARGATYCPECRADVYRISIHAPREGSDKFAGSCPGPAAHFYPRSPRGERPVPATIRRTNANFYPRSPRGERRVKEAVTMDNYLFLSTLPARGATVEDDPGLRVEKFLSTLPARGATKRYKGTTYEQVLFLSTLPARGATRIFKAARRSVA